MQNKKINIAELTDLTEITFENSPQQVELNLVK